MRCAVLALWVGAFLPARAAIGQAPAPVSTLRAAGQIGMGAVLTPVGFFGSGWATKELSRSMGVRDTTAARAAYIAAYTGAWLAAASGAVAVGRDGKPSRALLGSLAGLGGAFLTTQLGNALYDDDRRDCGVGCWTLGLVTVVLPSLGATIAYNASRR